MGLFTNVLDEAGKINFIKSQLLDIYLLRVLCDGWNGKYNKSISVAHGCIMAVLKKSTYATSCILKNSLFLLNKWHINWLFRPEYMTDTLLNMKQVPVTTKKKKEEYLLPVIKLEVSRKISNFCNLH